MRDRLDRLADRGTGIRFVVVSFSDDITRLAAYRDHLGLDVPVLADPDRALYRAVGAGRGSIRDVWSAGTLRMYAGLVARGRRLRMPHGDTRQLGADLLVDANGTARCVWLPEGPDRRPTIEQLARAVAELGD